MKTQITLNSRTFSKACQLEVVNVLPTAKSVKKSHVPSVGYVFFVYDSAKNKIAQCFSQNGSMVLNVL